MLTIRRMLLPLLLAVAARAQTPDWAERLPFDWLVTPNEVYRIASGQELKLDIYRPRVAAAPTPVIVYIHGGGWVTESKEAYTLALLPFMAMSLPVVSVEYRLGRVAPAPAAVEDCRCALRWVVANAGRFKFDPNRIVVAGSSAGGHLALMTGMLPASAGFDRSCVADPKIRWTASDRNEPKVAAIINWFGITDVRDLLESGGNPRAYAIEWVGNRDDAVQLADKVSPLTYVRAGLPPILTIHGDADPVVPPSHATRLHAALDQVNAPNRLLLVKGAGHGGFTPEQSRLAFAAVHEFLANAGIIK